MLKIVAAFLVVGKPLNKFAQIDCFNHNVTMPKKKKHAMELTDEEVLKRVFHPEIAKAVRKHLKGQTKQERKPKPKQ